MSEMGPILSTEWLTRYIFRRGFYNKDDVTVDYAAFIPPRRSNTTSVFRIDGLDSANIWQIGKTVAGKWRKESLKSRADILTSNVYGAGLNVQGVPETHPRHADIIGWPMEESAQKLRAIKLAGKAELCLLNS